MNISALGYHNSLNVTQLPSIPIAVEQTPPPFLGEVTFNDALPPHERAADAFQQMGYQVPEQNIQPPQVKDSLATINIKAKMLAHKVNSTNDNYNSAKGLLARQQIADGRPHIAGISEVIENIYTDYQKKYGELVKASTQYMQDMNTLASKMSRYIEAGDKGKINFAKEHILNSMDEIVAKYAGTSAKEKVKIEIKYNGTANAIGLSMLEEELAKETNLLKILEVTNKGVSGSFQSLIDKVKGEIAELKRQQQQLKDDNKRIEEQIKSNETRIGIGEYFGKWEPDYNKADPLMKIKGSKEEHEFWTKKLTGQGFVIKEIKGELRIYPDLKPIKEMFHAINHSSGKWNEGSDIMSQEFQSLQSAVDSQKNTINSSVSRLLETFRQDNSHFETLTQLLVQLYKDLQQYNNGYVNM
ncbi:MULTISPECIES: hypothetical protein [Providencia]|uniref:hypothetical protein n=1 Tax=Providencia TaxID=586 RepID=UPI002270B1C5|nr:MULTISPECIES: hypothetical protein [Providencia]MCX9116971.1 hypothetical protein [Providencia rettgeri]MDH2366591.1 hypothetical protein [Providencia rettgeri]